MSQHPDLQKRAADRVNSIIHRDGRSRAKNLKAVFSDITDLLQSRDPSDQDIAVRIVCTCSPHF